MKPLPGGDEETARKGRMLTALVRSMIVLGVLAAATSLLDPRNDVAVTAAFYGAILSALFGITALVRRGRMVLAAWIISLFFWLIIAFVTLYFGGLQGQYASTFAGGVLLIGVTVGGRAAIAVAVGSSVWCAIVGLIEAHGMLPDPIAPYSVVNAWTAVTATLILTSLLLHSALDSLQRMREREQEAARERDEALRRTIQAQKMEVVGTLTSGIAHDFNNLLTVIGGAAVVLRDGIDPDSESAEVLDDLDTATSRASLMTRQLLAFGRAPATQRVPVDLGELVAASRSMLPRLLGSTVEVETQTASGCIVMADPAGLEQVVLNLAVNARDAMPHGGVLRLVVEAAPDGGVVLNATDTGVGMDAATVERIFEPFFTTKSTGTGLGLATVRDRLAQFGGTVEVDSEPGRGTTFTLRFPPAGAGVRVTEPAARPAPVADRGVRRRVLVVEDDPLVRRSSTRLLEQQGFEVVAVADGHEALALLGAATDIACVVSDVVMPRMDGEALALALAEQHPGLPVVLVSGNSAPTGAAMAAAARAFVDKPIDARRLADVVTRLIG